MLNRLQIIYRLHWLKCSCVSQHLGSPRSDTGEWSGGLWLLSFPGRPWFTSATTVSPEAMRVVLSSQTAGCWQRVGTFSWGKADRTPRGKHPWFLKFTWESQSWVKPSPPERSLWRRWARMQQEIWVFVKWLKKKKVMLGCHLPLSPPGRSPSTLPESVRLGQQPGSDSAEGACGYQWQSDPHPAARARPGLGRQGRRVRGNSWLGLGRLPTPRLIAQTPRSPPGQPLCL